MIRSILIACVLIAGGCTSDQTMRMDGVTPGAGDAIAANTVLQMVDPWQRGVNDTDLLVPANSASAAATAPGASSASEAPATDESSSSVAN